MDPMDRIIDLQEPLVESNALKSYELIEYLPTSGSSLNTPGTVNIHIESLDEFYHPRRSYLYFEGDLLKADGKTRFAANDNVALTNNGLMYLFSNAKYELAGQEIESVNQPGIAGCILGTAKYPCGYAKKGAGLMQCWSADSDKTVLGDKGWISRHELTSKANPIGSFSFIVELENIFGFCEDYDKVLYGMRHKLSLVRTSDDDAILRVAAPGVSTVVLSRIAWMMPRVKPSDTVKYRLYKQIDSKLQIDCGFRKRQCCVTEIPSNARGFDWRLGVKSSPEKPRHILIAFQQDKSGDQTKNASIFDHLKLTQIYATLNDVRYPARDMMVDFKKHRYMEHYKSFIDFSRDFYGMDPLLAANFVDPITYKEEYPIFHIDVSKQSERITEGVIDIKIRMTFDDNPGEKCIAHALVISDRRMVFGSDGNKMHIVT